MRKAGSPSPSSVSVHSWTSGEPERAQCTRLLRPGALHWEAALLQADDAGWDAGPRGVQHTRE